MEFSQKLNILMATHDLTAYRLAKNIGVHQTSVKNWLNGKYPSTEHLAKLANYFATTVDRLISDDLYETNPDRVLSKALGTKYENEQKENPTTKNDSEVEDLQDPVFFRLKKGLESYNIDNEDIDFLLTVMKAHKERNK